MARVLLNVFQNVGMRLVSVNGGEKDNAIAKLSEAAIVVLPDSVDKAKKIIEDTFAEIKEEYRVTDPDANLTLNVRKPDMVDAFTYAATVATIIAMVKMPNGVQ